MDAFCPRCDRSYNSIEPPLARSGVCGDCNGQLLGAKIVGAKQPEGALAFVYTPESNIAQPFAAAYDEQVVERNALTQFPEASDPSMSDETNEFETEENDDEQGAEGAASPQQPSAADATTPDAFSLPNMDFSLPSFDGMDSIGSDASPASTASEPAASPASAPAAADGDVPAHLSLPSFPEFDMSLPAIPGMEEPEPELNVGIDVEFPDDDDDEDDDDDPDVAMPAHLAPEAQQQQPQTLPGFPPPGATNGQPPSSVLASLPDLGLPAMDTTPVAEEDDTLLDSDEADEIAAELKQRRSLVSMIIVLAALVLIGGGATVAVLGPKEVIAKISGKAVSKLKETPEQKAKALLVEGLDAYNQKKYRKAVEKYEKALEELPDFPEAHRNLGIALAKDKKQEAAVEHYKKYLALKPKAEDAAEVQKIIDDYEKANKDKDKKKKRRR